MRLQRLLNPRSIVFVGGAECAVAIECTRALGFEGRIWAVNPRRKQMGGVIYAAGFAESGDHSLQQALVAAAAGMPLLGPNCYGFINAASRVALWPDEHGLSPLDRGVAIVTQSGNIGCNLTMLQRGLPLATLLTLGNQADVDVAEAVAALAMDPRITAIGLHIEGLRDVTALATAAALAREQHKPIVALKTGRSPQGGRITLSHTASLAGADRLCDALFERYGIARVPTLTSLVEALKVLHCGGTLHGRQLLSLSCSGGEAALVADLAAERDLSFPPFPEPVARKLAATLDDLVTIDNPLDYHTFIWGRREQLENTFAAALDGGFDAAMLILDTPTHPAMKQDAWQLTARAFIEAQRRTGARAVVVASLPEGMPPALADELGRASIAPLIGIDDALQALFAAAFIGAQSRLPIAEAPWPLNAGQGGSATGLQGDSAGGLPGPFETLSELEAKRLLASFGVDFPASVECSIADAPAVAQRVGFPVAVKIANVSIAHKSDVGGVALSLGSTDAVAAAAARMAALGDRVLVEPMADDAVAELIVGVVRDPQFGLALLLGAGGVLAELLSDTVTLLLPATRADIEQALRRLKVWRLIEGYRGRSGDGGAVVRAIEAVITFADAHRDRLEELDINPLRVLPERAVAVDALIRLRTA